MPDLTPKPTLYISHVCTTGGTSGVSGDGGGDTYPTQMRSRLEARWAAFFDALGLRWVYEPRRMTLRGGDWYWPDFAVRGVGTVEIKPTYAAYAADTRYARFARESAAPYTVLIGPPSVRCPVLHWRGASGRWQFEELVGREFWTRYATPEQFKTACRAAR